MRQDLGDRQPGLIHERIHVLRLVRAEPGNMYRWKVYADDDDAKDVQTLLSASEYQMGIFSPAPDIVSEK